MQVRPSFRGSAVLACAVLGFLATYGTFRLLGTKDQPGDGEHESPSVVAPDPKLPALLAEAVDEVAASARNAAESSPGARGDAQLGPTESSNSSWGLLPRNSREFASMVIQGPLEGRLLLRNSQTNPRDTQIPIDAQGELGKYCADVAAQLARLDGIAATTAASDLHQLVEQGRSRSKHIRELEASLTPKEREIVEKANQKASELHAKILGKTPEEVRADPTFATIVADIHFKDSKPFAYGNAAGTIHYATPRELPNANAAVDAKRWACFEISAFLCGFFAHHGCLTPHEVEHLMSSIVTRLDQPPYGATK